MEQNYGNWQKYQNTNPLQRVLIGRFLERVKSLVIPLSGSSILDAGCGETFVLSALLQVRPDLQVAVGADTDYPALQRGRELFPRIGRIQSDILNLPYPSDSFDIVLCTEVLEHMTRPDVALAELCRVSTRYCLLSVPHEPFFRLSNLLRAKNISRLGNDVEHHQNWTHAQFVRFVSDHLDVLAAQRSFPWQIVLGKVR